MIAIYLKYLEGIKTKVKCPHCDAENDYPFSGFSLVAYRQICKNCNQWFNYCIPWKGYIEIIKN